MKPNKPILDSTQERLRLLARSKVTEVLNALANAESGKKFSELQFDLRINPSALSAILKKLTGVNYVSKSMGKYLITHEGRKAFSTCLELSSGFLNSNSVSTSFNDEQSCKKI